MKKAAIVQSNYIPWKGYFDMIAAVDEFILLEDVQYTRRDWRNRNQIKTPHGVKWLTVPVKVKGRYHQTIRDTEIDGSTWLTAHWRAITNNYRASLHFDELSAVFEPLYLQRNYSHLSDLNMVMLEAVCRFLNIDTRISNSSEYTIIEGKSERLVNLCEQVGAEEYVSGPAARDYLDSSPFFKKGISITWFDYSNYPVYPQLWSEFTHEVSILDLLFNCGKDAPRYMKFVKS